MSSAISSSTTPNASSSTSGAVAGSSLITSTGIGSGLNIGAIVSALTNAEGAGQQNEITSQQTTLNAQLSAFGTFSSALSTLQATVSTLQSPTALAGFTAAVADKTIASATTNSQAVAGQYSLAVQNLATAASLSSAPVANAATAIGTGTLQISVGGQSTSITIGPTNDTLAGIAATINAASNNPGVSASVLSTTAGARLVISGTETGAANAITVAETDGGTGLSSLTYIPANTTNSLTQTQAALDANFTVNGYAATSASNVVTSAISGVTLTLLAPTAPAVGSTPAATTTLTIAPDTSAAETSIGTFVTAVNGVLSAIQTLGGYNATTQTAGPLNGNATLEAFQTQLQDILDTVNSNSSGGASSLADLGIAADANTGQYDSNATTLQNALTSNLTSVTNLLGGANGIATQLNSLLTSYTGPGGLLSTITQGLQTSLSNVSKQQTDLNAQLAAYAATLTAQYNAMDTAVALLKQTQTYLNAEFNPSANLSSSGQSSGSSLNAGTTST
jgi:flagellar hook-associated protein 2